MTEKKTAAEKDPLMDRLKRIAAEKAEIAQSLGSSPNQAQKDSEPQDLEDFLDDTDMTEGEDVPPSSTRAPRAAVKGGSYAPRRAGRPRKGEEGQGLEPEVSFTTNIPQSLDHEINEYLKAPLGQIRTKKALVAFALKRFLKDTAVLRKRMNKAFEKEIGGF